MIAATREEKTNLIKQVETKRKRERETHRKIRMSLFLLLTHKVTHPLVLSMHNLFPCSYKQIVFQIKAFDTQNK